MVALTWPTVGYPQLWKCLGPDGQVTYTNDARLTRGQRCALLTLPETPNRPASTAPSSSANSRQARPLSLNRGDALRRQILTAEYEGERAQIAALEAQLAAAPHQERSALEARLDRHRRNLEAIGRELSRLP
jgi:hypothetical protein